MMSDPRKSWQIHPGKQLSGCIQVDSDKSGSHRALILNALAKGKADVSNLLTGQDVQMTFSALEQLGVPLRWTAPASVAIEGSGERSWSCSMDPIFLGNSGTAMRLLMGLLAGRNLACVLTGDASLNRRPMARVAVALKQMGAQIALFEDDYPPVHMSPCAQLKGIKYTMPVASAQVKSALLLAGLQAQGQTCIYEPAPTRDHTERMLKEMGVRLETNSGLIQINGPQTPKAVSFELAGDFSSAAFFIAAALLSPRSHVTIKNVNINPTRIGLLKALKQMGGKIGLTRKRMQNSEPVADIEVVYSPLSGISINPKWVASMIDEMPILAICAAKAKGTTQVQGASELKFKESNRIQSMVCGLRNIGIKAQALEDGFVVEGGTITGGHIDAGHDHRVAMSFAVAAHLSTQGIRIDGAEQVETSFPRFERIAKEIGFQISCVE